MGHFNIIHIYIQVYSLHHFFNTIPTSIEYIFYVATADNLFNTILH